MTSTFLRAGSGGIGTPGLHGHLEKVACGEPSVGLQSYTLL